MSYSDEHWTATCPNDGEELEKETIPSVAMVRPWLCPECNQNFSDAEVKFIHND